MKNPKENPTSHGVYSSKGRFLLLLLFCLLEKISCLPLYPHTESLTDILLENMIFEDNYGERKCAHIHKDVEDDIHTDFDSNENNIHFSTRKLSYRDGSSGVFHRSVDCKDDFIESLLSSSPHSSSITYPSSPSAVYASDKTFSNIPSYAQLSLTDLMSIRKEPPSYLDNTLSSSSLHKDHNQKKSKNIYQSLSSLSSLVNLQEFIQKKKEEMIHRQEFSSGHTNFHAGDQLSNNDGTDSFYQQQLSSGISPYQQFYHGTTTCSFKYKDGILIAVDSRASMGQYIGTGAAKKVIPLSKYCVGTMAGGAADCSFWLRYVAMERRNWEMNQSNGQPMTTSQTSKLLAKHLSQYVGVPKELALSVGTMIMGYDKPKDAFSKNSEIQEEEEEKGAFRIYYVDNEGTRKEGDIFAVGSGSTYAYSILDAYDSGKRKDINYGVDALKDRRKSSYDKKESDSKTKTLKELNLDEAVMVGLRAIRHATYRDAFSGGYINIFAITKEKGWHKILTVDSGYLEV